MLSSRQHLSSYSLFQTCRCSRCSRWGNWVYKFNSASAPADESVIGHLISSIRWRALFSFLALFPPTLLGLSLIGYLLPSGWHNDRSSVSVEPNMLAAIFFWGFGLLYFFFRFCEYSRFMRIWPIRLCHFRFLSPLERTAMADDVQTSDSHKAHSARML